MANFCQQVLKPLGSYTRVFTVIKHSIFKNLEFNFRGSLIFRDFLKIALINKSRENEKHYKGSLILVTSLIP